MDTTDTFDNADTLADDAWGHVSLGDDYDCETCGFTLNQFEWTEEFAGHIHLSTSIGCYGGDDLTTDSEAEAAAFIKDVAKRFPGAEAKLTAELDRLAVKLL